MVHVIINIQMSTVSVQYPEDDNELVDWCDTIMNWDTLLHSLINGDSTVNAMDAYFQLAIDAEAPPVHVDAHTDIVPDDVAPLNDVISRYNGINVNIIYDMTKDRRLCIEIANARRPPQFKSESMYIASMFMSIGNEMKRRGILHTWFNITVLNKVLNGMGIFREFMSKGSLQYRVKRGFPIFDSYIFSGRCLNMYIYRFSADCLNFFNNYPGVPVYHLSNPDVVRRLVDKSHYVTNPDDIQLATVDFSVDYIRIINAIGCTR